MRHSARVAAISGVISSAGDILLQLREGLRKPTDWDMRRTANLAGYRMVHGPLVDRCWQWFDRRLPMAGSLRGALLRAMSDQVLLMPPSLVALFLSQGLLEGLSLDDSILRCKEQGVAAAQIAVPFWLVAHTITFAAFPPHLRMVWAQSCGVVWNALCSEQNQIARKREGLRRQQEETTMPTAAAAAASGPLLVAQPAEAIETLCSVGKSYLASGEQ